MNDTNARKHFSEELYKTKRQLLDNYVTKYLSDNKHKLKGFVRFDPDYLPLEPLPKDTQCYYISQCYMDIMRFGYIYKHKYPYRFNITIPTGEDSFVRDNINAIEYIIFFKMPENYPSYLPLKPHEGNIVEKEDTPYNPEFDEIFEEETEDIEDFIKKKKKLKYKKHKEKKKSSEAFNCVLYYEDGVMKNLHVPKQEKEHHRHHHHHHNKETKSKRKVTF